MTTQTQVQDDVSQDEELLERIEDRTARVGVVGLGYVGLPLAVALCDAGFEVRGVDVARDKVASINDGRSPIADIEDDVLAAAVASGRLTAHSEYEPLGECDVIFVCVPTPFDANKTPDLRFVHAAADGVAGQLRPGQLVVLQSTTYPGTTEEAVRPRLERGGLEAGRDFFLAFSPERIDPGVPEHTVRNTPKVVGGVSPRDAALAAAVLRSLGPQVHVVSTPRAAEMSKLLENTFRAVNIALVNELALLCERMGIDVWEVINAASTKPFGFMPFRPGAGVGGHCIPVDPHYLAWKAREYDFPPRFIELAAEINSRMPHHVMDLVTDALNGSGKTVGGSRSLVLGVAFKPDVDDPRNSPAERLIDLLLERGADVRYHDPHVPEFTLSENPFMSSRRTLRSVPLTADELRAADVVVIVTPHKEVDYDLVGANADLIVDTADAMRGRTAANVRRLGAAAREGTKPVGPADANEPAGTDGPTDSVEALPL
jgi:UDP-N-acetyl-D-glucosamine dehydrogenase